MKKSHSKATNRSIPYIWAEAARVFSPAAAVRHPKFGIPVGGFAYYCGFWVFHRLFYSLFVIEGRVFIGN